VFDAVYFAIPNAFGRLPRELNFQAWVPKAYFGHMRELTYFGYGAASTLDQSPRSGSASGSRAPALSRTG
jgi:hypothetical protein